MLFFYCQIKESQTLIFLIINYINPFWQAISFSITSFYFTNCSLDFYEMWHMGLIDNVLSKSEIKNKKLKIVNLKCKQKFKKIIWLWHTS